MFNLFRKKKNETLEKRYVLTETEVENFGFQTHWAVIKSKSAKKVLEVLNNIESINKDNIGIITDTHSDMIIINDRHLELCKLNRNWELEFDDLRELSRHFDTVYYFLTHTVSDVYGWFKFENNEIIRGFYTLEMKVPLDKGEKTKEEKDFNMNYSVADEPEDCVLPDEEDVMDIAEAWTLNPLYLTEITGVKAYRITKE
ncbi:hypothetical protein [Sebaldella sp. S0638]|uniref:hypothetical protein n=1 Tax=Sebaldella sp. S0638 TaxID=2957809 RepID=UPI00209E0362|nr:hypothetical protein [Sebaldella sp. S0638]MCP1224664.1 hypothetical protein [Sebaldella sp. S0638]